MDTSAGHNLLLRLLTDLEGITQDQFRSPQEELPEYAKVLGTATFAMKQVWTLYELLCLELADTAEAQRKNKVLEMLSEETAQQLTQKEFDALEAELEKINATLSPKLMLRGALWAYFLCLAAQAFPSDAFVEFDFQVGIFQGWVVAAVPEECDGEDNESEPPEPANDAHGPAQVSVVHASREVPLDDSGPPQGTRVH